MKNGGAAGCGIPLVLREKGDRMDLLTQAREYLSRDPLRYVDMLEPVRRGMVEVTALREDGVLLYNVPGELYMLAADSLGFLPGPFAPGWIPWSWRLPTARRRESFCGGGTGSSAAGAAPRRPFWAGSCLLRQERWRSALWGRNFFRRCLKITTPSPIPNTSGSGWRLG